MPDLARCARPARRLAAEAEAAEAEAAEAEAAEAARFTSGAAASAAAKGAAAGMFSKECAKQPGRAHPSPPLLASSTGSPPTAAATAAAVRGLSCPRCLGVLARRGWQGVVDLRGRHATSMYEVDVWSTRGPPAAVDGLVSTRARCRGLLLAVDGLTRGELGRKLSGRSSVGRGMSASMAACCTKLGCLRA